MQEDSKDNSDPSRIVLDAIVNFQSSKISNSNLSSALYLSSANKESPNLDEIIEKEIEASNKLIKALTRTKIPSENALLSGRNVCDEVVLPFVLSRLLYVVQGSISNSDLVIRKNLFGCYTKLLAEILSMLFEESETDAAVPSCLTQSVLQKIIPYLSKVANETGDSNISRSISIIVKFGTIFKPSLTICHNLLAQQDSFLRENAEVDPASSQVIESFLHLFLSIQGSLNPKKVFQIICSNGFLSMVSRMASLGDNHFSLVRTILLDGLFNVEHIEGYQSAFLALEKLKDKVEHKCEMSNLKQMDKKSKTILFCYQEELFSCLKITFHDTNRENIKYSASLLPMLLAGFIDRFKASGNPHLNAETLQQMKKRKISETAESCEFLFWKWITSDALKYLHNHDSLDFTQRLAITKAIRETLQILLDHDIYSPSTSCEAMHSTLQQFATSILRCIQSEPIESHVSNKKELLIDQMRILQLIFDLNHRLYHDNLAEIFYAINHHYRLDGCSESSILFSSIVTLYSKLRQLPHLFNSFYLYLLNDDQSIPHLQSNNEIVRSLLSAIQTCPNAQLTELWEICDNNVFTKSAKEAPQDSIDLFVILIQSISVSPSNSNSIKQLCLTCWHHLLGTFDISMLQNPDKKSDNLLRLCGYLMELYTKCDFFHEVVINNETDSGNEAIDSLDNNEFDVLLKKLTDWITKDLSPIEMKKLPKSMILSLQHLSMQRIRRLHSILYLHEESRLINHYENDHESTALQNEAISLVRFCFFVTTSIDKEGDCNNSWKLIARNINIWANYSSKTHNKYFLKWFLFEKNSHEKENIVSQILNDAAFFELDVISQTFMDVMTEELSNTLNKMFLSKGNSKLVPSISRVPLLISDFAEWTILSSDEFSNLLTPTPKDMKKATKTFEGGLKQYTEVEKSIVKDINKLSHLLMIVISVPDEVFRSNTLSCVKFVDLCIRLDALSRVILYFAPNQSLWLNICSHSRAIFSHQLCGLNALSQRCPYLESDNIIDVTTGLHESLEKLLEVVPDSQCLDSLLLKTCAVMEGIVQNCLLNESYLAKLVEGIICFMVKGFVQQSRRLISRLIHSSVRSILNSINDLEDLSQSIKLSLLALLEACEDFSFKSINNYETFENVLVLSADILRLRVRLNSVLTKSDCLSDKDKLKSEVEWQKQYNLVFARSLHELKDSSSPFHTEGIYFCSTFLYSIFPENQSCVLSVILSANNAIETIADVLIGNLEICCSRYSLLDTLCSSFALFASHDELQSFLSRLTTSSSKKKYISSDSGVTDGVSSRVLHNFRIILTLVKGSNRRKCVSKFIRPMIILGHEILASSRKKERESEGALAFFNSLIARKDLFLLNGQDISNILFQISSLSRENQYQHIHTFHLCCSILRSLLKHYTKKTYSVVQNFVVSLQILMCALLESKADKDSKVQIALCYLKVCEVLPNHKEVFKKHVIGLILTYSSYLGAGRIDIHMKKETSEIIFLLLDVCSEFEIKQLTCMMDSTDKSLFRSLFQTYQKQHKYHGQY